MKIEKNYCRIRKDLIESGFMIPLITLTECVYISTKRKRQYRWINDDEMFQIKYRGKWYYAESVDFEF